ncbi:hypothetical protein PtA15_1A873 [Puccinia triticina]|nr:uncharacterized protein PtA15_1A873 [Puccinia triticina]WAQ81531.1 hypothetical protein PtA15_1A873 [Puccinia triticina]WAR52414.1 hypothetical protein PtB15_1B856 [Puccinia triticina]
MFQTSSQRAAFLTFLSDNSPTAPELTKEDFSALSMLWDALRRTTIEEDQTNPSSQSIISPTLYPDKKSQEPSIRLKRRQVASNESTQEISLPNNYLHSAAESVPETRANQFRDADLVSNLREAAPLNNLADASPEKSGSGSTDTELTDSALLGPGKSANQSETQVPSGKSPTGGPPKAPPKAQAQKTPPGSSLMEDPGLKGLIIIGTAAFIISIFLLLRKKFASIPESEIPMASEKLGGPPSVVGYGGDVDISGPMGNSNATQVTREARPGYQVPKIASSKVPVARPSVRSQPNTGKPVSLPSSVKITKQRTRVASSNQGKDGQPQRTSPRPRGRGNSNTQA